MINTALHNCDRSNNTNRDATTVRFSAADLHDFITRAMRAVRMSDEDAGLVADVLTSADLRGIDSHGIARLERFYIDLLRAGRIDHAAVPTTLHRAYTSLTIDAQNGLGHPVSVKAMADTIALAADAGIAVATVRNSNHHGATSYYAMMALSRNMIGVAATNTPRLMAPTFGREALLGTNPIAVAVPAAGDDSFVLDMATSAVAYGKLEVAARSGSPLKAGWALDSGGRETLDALAALNGALIPLGGRGSDSGGHKGYGLSVLVELLTGVLSGGLFGSSLPTSTNFFDPPGSTSHLFMAIDIARFRNISAFRADVETLLTELRESQPADGSVHVYAPGDLEREAARKRLVCGILLDAATIVSLCRLSRELDIALPFPLHTSHRAMPVDLSRLAFLRPL